MGLVLGALLVHLVPVLGSPEPAAPATAALLLGLIALLACTPRVPMPAAVVRATAPRAGAAPPLLLAGRVTDPVHHPRRPRAPGQT